MKKPAAKPKSPVKKAAVSKSPVKKPTSAAKPSSPLKKVAVAQEKQKKRDVKAAQKLSDKLDKMAAPAKPKVAEVPRAKASPAKKQASPAKP